MATISSSLSVTYEFCFLLSGIHAQALSEDVAGDHIAKYGTNHTEAIVTENQAAAERFIAISDCAAVMINISTRFTDDEQMGFGWKFIFPIRSCMQ